MSTMRWMRLGKRGQFIIEYAILIGIVIFALSALSVYLSRALQGQTKLINDEFSEAGETWELAYEASLGSLPSRPTVATTALVRPTLVATTAAGRGTGTAAGGAAAITPLRRPSRALCKTEQLSGKNIAPAKNPQVVNRPTEAKVAHKAKDAGAALTEGGFGEIVEEWWVYPEEEADFGYDGGGPTPE